MMGMVFMFWFLVKVGRVDVGWFLTEVREAVGGGVASASVGCEGCSDWAVGWHLIINIIIRWYVLNINFRWLKNNSRNFMVMIIDLLKSEWVLWKE